jgi:heptaprenyl diphosphate synthase
MEKFTYEQALEQVKQEINQALTRSPRMIREYLTHLTLSQGKMIRAVSVLTAAIDQDVACSYEAIRVAAAIEIIHLSSLVHDDIIDNADLRRGHETLQKKYGKRTAVICGDYLLSLALKMIASLEHRKDYLDIQIPDYISKLCLGELNQHINNHNLDLTMFEYIRIIGGKTAALFEASFFAGAVIAGESEKNCKKYAKIGYYIGMIFQLMDDCMDFETTVATMKKPVQSDYEQGVITLPLIYTFFQKPEFAKRAKNEGINRTEINQAVEEAKGLAYTRSIVTRYYKKAEKLIQSLSLTADKEDKMVSILNKSAQTMA